MAARLPNQSRMIPDGIRDAIWTELQAGGSRLGIAKRFGVSHHAVRQVALAHGMTNQVQSERLKTATHLHVLTTRAKRAVEVERALEDARRVREQLFQPAQLHQFDSKNGVWVDLELDEPDFKGKQALAITFGILVDKHLQLEKHDAEGLSAGKAAIVALVETLKVDVAAAS